MSSQLKSSSLQLGKKSVQVFWQSVNWDDTEIVESVHPWAISVQQYFATIAWSNTGANVAVNLGENMLSPKNSALPEKATLENFLDDISQFF